MIQPPQLRGAAFSEARDGDIRNDLDSRVVLSEALGVSGHWATVHQIHSREVVRVAKAGEAGEADAIWTTEQDLPVAVFTADCFGVVIEAPGAVGVAHAGWRGTLAGVVESLRLDMETNGHTPTTAGIGPGIGPCCFEVSQELVTKFPGAGASTTWATDSVDLSISIGAQLEGLETWVSGSCTYHDDGWFSHRGKDGLQRLTTIGWLT
jgi:copper oxidase (laccase) domain-containing protein